MRGRAAFADRFAAWEGVVSRQRMHLRRLLLNTKESKLLLAALGLLNQSAYFDASASMRMQLRATKNLRHQDHPFNGINCRMTIANGKLNPLLRTSTQWQIKKELGRVTMSLINQVVSFAKSDQRLCSRYSSRHHYALTAQSALAVAYTTGLRAPSTSN